MPFNKQNTFQWFKANSHAIESEYKTGDRAVAFARAIEAAPYPLGVFYESDERRPFEELLSPYQEDSRPLRIRERNMAALRSAILEKR